MPDVRIVNADQNHPPIVAVDVATLARKNALIVALVNASGDIYNASGGGGGSGGDGAILDGADSNIKASVKSTAGAKPLHVIITNVSGDTPNLPSSNPDGSIVDGVSPSVKATVRDYANSNPIAVVLTNVSGDTYNAGGGGGGSGGDGAILDGADNNIKATVLQNPTDRPQAGDNPLLVQFADDASREIGRISSPIGVNVIGGSLGASVSASGDFDIRDLTIADKVTVGLVTSPIGVTGDISTTPKSGSVWPVQQSGALATSVTGDVLLRSNQGVNIGNVGITTPIGVQVIGGSIGGRVSISGDSLTVTATDFDVRNLNDSQDSVHVARGQVGITGDVLLRQNTGTDIGNVGIKSGQEINVREQSKTGVHVSGGIVGVSGDITATNLDIRDLTVTDIITIGRITVPVGVSGDVSTTPKAGQTWPIQQSGGLAVSVTGDVLLRSNAGVNIGNVGAVSPIGVQIIGGSVGARISASGDLDIRDLSPSQDSVRIHGGVVGVTGDRSITDGSDVSIKATVKNYANSKPLVVALANVSGDVYNAGGGGGGGDGAIVDGVSSSIKATVRDYTNSNPLQVVLANSSGDSYNANQYPLTAVNHGRSPSPNASGDYVNPIANRHGVPFFLGGHPNVLTLRANYTAAQTDAAIVTVGAGTKIAVTRLSVTADNANTVDVQARIGFGATTTPTTTGVLLSHPGITAGSGVIEGNGSGILGVGADGEDLRITSEVPTGGSIDTVVSYFTIES